MKDNFETENSDVKTLGLLLATLFPCYSGIFNGAEKSLVLKNPAKSLKKGAFVSIIISFIMYISMIILWGSVATGKYLTWEH